MRPFRLFQLCSLPLVVVGRTFTVFNACPFTICPAQLTDLNVGSAVPNFQTGWQANAFTSVSFTGRRNCNFSTNPGPNSCLTGGCNGGLQCDRRTGTGVPPATVADFTLQGDGNRDFYDVSHDHEHRGYAVAACPVDSGPDCPAQLKGPFESSGLPVGCKSACFANLDGNQGMCSSLQWSIQHSQTCPASGVAFYSYFKNNYRNSYAYAYDEGSGTALWTCNSSLLADYTVTFCPCSRDPRFAGHLAGLS
ncbi:thaumatin-like protein [Pterulicium gracile]|uniref:Thaumatin-like protein n=1 Tax=Pterulicium gracile TaxID=1884261 RepID=A0A5C3QB62_9AGAR|nr:thaumatin-like protein [Pterula gracilis]